MPESEGGKPAQTLYRVKRRFKTHTLVELEPLTGRTHQLRIHCNLIGHPIVGDPIYASAADPLTAKNNLKHHLLHAARLVFRHPATGKEVNLEAPLPKAIVDLISELSTTPSKREDAL
jgi:23S rRNA-/tRNA-specific pseudouridylate synthase